MQIYKNLTIIGTSHIAIESVREVERILTEQSPDIVALELDKLRFHSIISNEKGKFRIKDIFRIGLKGYLFGAAGAWVEKKLGQFVGVPPGTEMKKAILIAKSQGCRIALVDQDIRITLKRLSKEITWKERFRFVYDVLKAIIWRKPVVNFDLRKVPDEKTINFLLIKVKKDYPSIYKVLVYERNIFMSKNLYKLMNIGQNIVAVVGVGHEKEIIRLIQKYESNTSPH